MSIWGKIISKLLVNNMSFLRYAKSLTSRNARRKILKRVSCMEHRFWESGIHFSLNFNFCSYVWLDIKEFSQNYLTYTSVQMTRGHKQIIVYIRT